MMNCVGSEAFFRNGVSDWTKLYSSYEGDPMVQFGRKVDWYWLKLETLVEKPRTRAPRVMF